MQLFQRTFKLFNRSRHKTIDPIVHRLCSGGKPINIDNNTNDLTNVTESKDLTRIKDDELRAALKNQFEMGVRITSYSTHGFRLNHHVHVIGPTILFPKAVFSWNVAGPKFVTAESLSIFGLVEPRIETLIIGTGEELTSQNVGKAILEISHKYKLNIEVLCTELACTQFNYLNTDGRMVAAALIPPSHLPIRDDDVFSTLSLDNKEFTYEEMNTPRLDKIKPINWKK